MNFIRPEVQALLNKWREVLAAAGVILAGLWFLTSSQWLWQALGVVITVAGLGLGFVAFRRARFATQADGPGVVEVDERQISYYAPEHGGVVSIEMLARVSAVSPKDSAGPDALNWVLEEDGGTTLVIPNAAAGAQNLFDAFAALPGVDYAKAQKALAEMSGDSFVIWTKPRAALH